jgi:membrane protein DedA with SNARE-associated domain
MNCERSIGLNVCRPQLPHFGFTLVFLVVFLSNIGVPFPGKAILFGAGFVWGRAAGSLWSPC